jgi:hypothetical protein
MPVRLRNDPDRDIPYGQFEIEYEDVFHMKLLYKRLYEFLVDEGWKAADSDGADTNFETLYWERSNSAGDAKDSHIWWRCFRIPEGNPYYRYFLKVDIQTLQIRKVEVMHKGQKFATNKGDVIIRVAGYLQLDYKNEWQNSSLLKPFDNWFRERIYHKEVEDYKKDLYKAVYRVNTFVKQYLQLKNSTTDWGRAFHPEKGI